MNLAITMLRLCFVALFGTMSLVHGPVMTFSGALAVSGAHAVTAAAHAHAGPSNDAEPDCHEDQAPPAKHAECNAFACFMAVEPLPVIARPLTPILFAVMAAAPMTALDPVRTAPALPPPRFQG
jgi:hypothetical protein